VSAAAEVSVHGRVVPLPAATVRKAVRAVLTGEHRHATVSVTFLGREAMRQMNLHHKGHDFPTDVISFALPDPRGGPLGDLYICRWQADREARRRGLTLREELIRLVIHGTLHLLGWDHDDGAGREASSMWVKQEHYLRKVM
jgi:probable rRNA maturation factor